MNQAIDLQAQKTLFTEARTHMAWQDKAIEKETLEAVYELAKWGPTSVNCLPMRLVFLHSEAAQQRIKPFIAEGNIEKAMSAPVIAIIAMDTQFYEHLPTLFPVMDVQPMFIDNPALTDSTAMRNSSLQGGYLIMAARALGLDCGPMSGFDADGVDQEFFPDGRFKTNFLMNIGYGDSERLYPRGPRLSYEEAVSVL